MVAKPLSPFELQKNALTEKALQIKMQETFCTCRTRAKITTIKNFSHADKKIFF